MLILVLAWKTTSILLVVKAVEMSLSNKSICRNFEFSNLYFISGTTKRVSPSNPITTSGSSWTSHWPLTKETPQRAPWHSFSGSHTLVRSGPHTSLYHSGCSSPRWVHTSLYHSLTFICASLFSLLRWAVGTYHRLVTLHHWWAEQSCAWSRSPQFIRRLIFTTTHSGQFGGFPTRTGPWVWESDSESRLQSEASRSLSTSDYQSSASQILSVV